MSKNINRDNIINFLADYGLYIGLGLISITFSILSPHFLRMGNIMNVLRQVSIIGVIASGMTFVILMGDFDLSVGSLVALSGVVVALLQVNLGFGTILSVIGALIFITLLGLLNGILIVKLHVPAFVATLGMMSAARGMALILSDGYPISGLTESFRTIGAGYFLGIPNPVIIYFASILISYVVLSRMKFGRLVYGIGGNIEAVKLSGINTDKYRIMIFGISAFAAAVSGIILAARINSGQPTAGTGFELDVIAAVVIGGTSLSGGKGGVIGTFFGALLVGVLGNGLNLLGVSSFYQQLAQGIVIVIAVMADQFRKN
jgi:ribose/xylose/arabinose/galactoside ABC-type transport system permease subunit